MISNYQSQIDRLERELANLERDAATEAKKEADLIQRINRAEYGAQRASNVSTRHFHLRTIERHFRDIAATKKRQAYIAKRKSEKSKSLRDYLGRQVREDEKARKNAAEGQRKLMREREAHERRLAYKLRSRAFLESNLQYGDNKPKKYDFFICHASEDKADFVQGLAECLKARQAMVWYDEFALNVGDSLRREIDRGLGSSQFGIVVLSEHFSRRSGHREN